MIRFPLVVAFVFSMLVPSAALAQFPALGAQPVIFVKLHFNGDPPYTTTFDLANLMAESDKRVRYISRGKAWLDAMALGTVVNINATAGDSFFTIQSLAEAEYARVVSGSIPATTPCRKRLYLFDPSRYNGGGNSQVGSCASLIKDVSSDVSVHEWLHAVGFMHEYIGAIPDYSCANSSCDTHTLGYPSPWMADRLGWVTPPVSPCDGSTYTIKPWELADGSGTTRKFAVDSIFYLPADASGSPKVVYLAVAYDSIYLSTGGGPYPYRLDTDTAPGIFREYMPAGASVTFPPCRFTHAGVNPDRSVNVIASSASAPPPPPPDPNPNPPPPQSADLTTGGTATSSETASPANEGVAQAFDDKTSTKWLTWRGSNVWLAYQFPSAATVLSYAVTSANDVDGRDPKDWRLEGSTDGSTWTTLDTRTAQTFASRFLKQTYSLAASATYTRYRLFIIANRGASETQLAELELFGTGGGTPPPPPDPCTTTPYVLTASDVQQALSAKGVASWSGSITAIDSRKCPATVTQ